MASSMSTGDKRWAPTRKSGMTVLGKVPKPINLPSQRSENHGLDPNVEIVPKGTLTWGSRPSSTTTNAWGSSSQSSPNTDRIVGSPSQVNGYPSSSGTGTRPSTAGSDRSFAPLSNAWTSNSRPSSASGLLVSNQSSLATRPRSAETRPGSSQLSRFADENSIPRAAGSAEGLEHASSKATDFTLSSGDFPTLGLEKNLESHVQQANHNPHGRPSSASGIETGQKERAPVSSIGDEPLIDEPSDKEVAQTWKPNTPPNTGRGPASNSNHHREAHVAQTCPTMNFHQHLNAWRGPSLHRPPDGVWYRGVSPGVPFRQTGPPGGHSSEPFAYYSSQLPAGSASSSQSTLRATAVLGRYPCKNEQFHLHMSPDRYAVPTSPVIPGRPGVYPGPMPYDGYYCPSDLNTDKSSAMTSGHGICNQYQHQNAPNERGNFNACNSGYIELGINQQKFEASHNHEARRGQYKVLLKQHDGHVGSNSSDENREQPLMVNIPCHGAIDHPTAIARESDSREARNTAKVDIGETSMEPASDSSGVFQAASLGKLPDISSEVKEVDNISGGTFNSGITFSDSCQYPVKKNTKLIEKIEGINNKVRISDGHSEGSFDAKVDHTRKNRNEKKKIDKSAGLQDSHVSFENVSNSSGKDSCVVSDSHVPENFMKENNKDHANVKIMPQSCEANPIFHSDTLDVGPRIHYHATKNTRGMHGWTESHAKTRTNIPGDDEWRKHASKNDSSTNAIENMGNFSEARGQSVAQEFPNQKGSHSENKDGNKLYALSSLDMTDYQAQRAKMREIATQRAKQLQQEEEERTREQKAKALAKLEELNKRTSAESSNKNGNLFQQNNDLQVPQSSLDSIDHATGNCEVTAGDSVSDESLEAEGTDTSQKVGTDRIRIEEFILVQASNSGTVRPVSSNLMQRSDSGYNKPEEGLDSVANSDSGSNKDFQSISCNSSMPSDLSRPAFKKFNVQESNVTKQRQMGHRKKQNIQQGNTFFERPISTVDADGCKGGHATAEAALTNNPNEIGDNLVKNKKKNGRVIRSKNKPVEALVSLPVSHNEGILENPRESEMTKLELISDAVPVDQPLEETIKSHNSRDAPVSSNQAWFQGADEGCGKTVSQWRVNPPKRTKKTLTRSEKIHGEAVWAPVKPLSKSELTNPSGKIEATEVVPYKMPNEACSHSDKNANGAMSPFKSKRAEIERYVPKAIARDPSRQGSSHHSSDVQQTMLLPVDIANLDTESSLAETAVEHKNWDHGRPSKHGKSYTLRWQRNSHERVSSPDEVATIQQPVIEKQSMKRDTVRPCDAWSIDTANVSPNDSNVVSSEGKGTTGRVKRQGHKVDKAVGLNPTISDANNLPQGSTKKLDTHLPASGWSEVDTKSAFRNENRNVGEHTRVQWKPKSQVHFSHRQEESNRVNEGQLTGQSGVTDKGSTLQHASNHQMQNVENKINISPSLLPEARNVNHYEARKDRKYKSGSSKDQAVLQNQDSSHVTKQAPASTESLQVQERGMRRYGQRNGQFDKGREANYVAGVQGFGQDSGENNLPIKNDRPRHNSHYEYQKIESHDKTTDSNVTVTDESKEVFHAAGPDYRGRGQHYFRRGGQLYVRNAGPSKNGGRREIRE